MILPNTVTINTEDGQLTLDQVDIVIVDDSRLKTVKVRLHPLKKLMLVWQKEDYDTAGDYTQQQLEDAVYQILSDGNLVSNLEALY